MTRPALPDLAAVALALAFAIACALFVRQPTLATFADDSVSYLVMAQAFSPFQAASPALAGAFAREAFYPPLFPLLLALSGASHDIAWAHVVTALLLAASLPLAYLLGVRWLGSRGPALAAVACLALLPSLWINSKGILSEPLFCLLLVSSFLYLEKEKTSGWKLGMLLVALALTRTAALPMVAVYGLWALAQRGAWTARLRAAAPALAAFAAYGLWVLIRPVHTGDDYARIVLERGHGFFDAPGGFWAALAASLGRQVNAIVEGWAGSLMIFWVEGQPLRFALSGVAGVLALCGLAIRIARGKADGWMMLAYLGTLLAWPFYEQMERFLFPALPILILYAFVAAGEAARAMSPMSQRSALAQALLVALLLSLTLPAMAFIGQRAQAAGPYPAITDWYRTPDLARARNRAQTHLDLLDDMRAIRELTQPGDLVMWVVPGYIALLADRRGVVAPDASLDAAAYLEAVRRSGADYVFLSRYHPRETIRDSAWQAGVRALAGEAKAVHTHTQDNGSIVSSILLRAPK